MLFGCLTLNGARQLIAVRRNELVERRLNIPRIFRRIQGSRHHSCIHRAHRCGRARRQHSSSRRYVGGLCLANTRAKGVGAEEDAAERRPAPVRGPLAQRTACAARVAGWALQ